MMTEAVLALNAGSSSIKFGLFKRHPRDVLTLICKGLLEDGGASPRLVANTPEGQVLQDRRWKEGTAPANLLGETINWIEGHLGTNRLVGVGHRIVHGGREFRRPVRLDENVISAIDRLTPLAPLHQPRSLAPIRALRKLRPELLQVGVFDTAFHHDLAPPVSRYAIPRQFEEAGIRKYGFHGLSYEYIAGQLAEIDADLPRKRTIVAHLGQGASLCAMRNGVSIDTTMGFTALDGLVMGTRCGAIDPGVVLYLQRAHNLNAETVEHMLYHDSGLLGVSGISSDMRVLEASDDLRAREAIDLFAFRVARETSALANTLGGLELLVFTGGIGEHSSAARAAVCERLAWLGLTVEPKRNESAERRIDAHKSAIEVRIIATNEEIVIAKHVAAFVVN